MADNQSEVRQTYEAQLAASKAAYREAQNKVNEADKARSQLIAERKTAESNLNTSTTRLERNRVNESSLKNQVAVLDLKIKAAPKKSFEREELIQERSYKAVELEVQQNQIADLESKTKAAEAKVNEIENKLQDTRNIIKQNNDISYSELQKTNEIESNLKKLGPAPPGTNVQAPVTSPTETQATQAEPNPTAQKSTLNEIPASTEDTTTQKVTTVDITTTDPSANPDTLLTPAESIAKAQKQPEAQDPQALAADQVNSTNTGITEAIKKNPVSSAGDNTNTGTNVAGSVDAARKEGVVQTSFSARQQDDWRVRIQLAQGADYLYVNAQEGDILFPLKATNGVVFPYTPQIQMGYKANYDVIDLVHNNYKQYFYKNSSVEDIIITCEFTAQDTGEADYLLAVMHFFKSVTKMFFGQDGNNGGPRAGTPPPLCYISGLGQYQFNDSPLLISSFSYTLPNDVDYIRAGSTTQYSGVNLGAYTPKEKGYTNKYMPGLDRLRGSKLERGGMNPEPAFVYLANSTATYMPTKIQLQISAYPIVTRRKTATEFSLEAYATGKLLNKGFW